MSGPTPNETQRVLALPRVDYSTRDLDNLRARLTYPGSKLQLKDVQCESLLAIEHMGGAVLPLGVGKGKTLTAYLAPSMLQHINRLVIITKSGVVDQTRAEKYKMARYFRIRDIPTEVYSYSTLSRRDELSAWIGPTPERTLLVLDEAHALKNPKAARTLRFMRDWQEVNGYCSLLVMSGTLIVQGIRDVAHLANAALGRMSCFPTGFHLQEWANWLDGKGRGGNVGAGLLNQVIRQYGTMERGLSFTERAQHAFYARFKSAPGVVTSESTEGTTPIVIHLLRHPTIPDHVLQMIKTGKNPDGSEVVGGDEEEELPLRGLERTLSTGYYKRFLWGPDGVDYEWVGARAAWAAHATAEIACNAGRNYDSLLHISNRIGRQYEQGRRSDIHQAWNDWQEQKARRDPPDTEIVWVDDFFVNWVVEYAKGLDEPHMLWRRHTPLANRLRELGLTVVNPGKTPTLVTENLKGRPTIEVLSIGSHGTGLNMQMFARTTILEPMASGGMWEQLLGRFDRTGQSAEEIHVWVMAHCDSYKRTLQNARQSAKHLGNLLGTRFKLTAAKWL